MEQAEDIELFELQYFDILWDIFLKLYEYDYENYIYTIEKTDFKQFYKILFPYIDVKNSIYAYDSSDDDEEEDDEYIF